MSGKLKSRDNSYWKNRLTREVFQVCRLGVTEEPFSGKYNKFYKKGNYHCIVCGSKLFSSDTKYDSGTGWPSFWDYIKDGAINKREDNSLGMLRTEVTCAKCGSHLGHVFADGPQAIADGKTATGKRYCINSLALDFRSRTGEG
jgi:peptide-methionine (R)-S-oxide reductase